jgi:hypothetical protein
VITFLKWVSTVVLISGAAVNSLGFWPAGPVMLILGGIGWLTVAVAWRDSALIVTNSCMVMAGLLPLLWSVYAA